MIFKKNVFINDKDIKDKIEEFCNIDKRFSSLVLKDGDIDIRHSLVDVIIKTTNSDFYEIKQEHLQDKNIYISIDQIIKIMSENKDEKKSLVIYCDNITFHANDFIISFIVNRYKDSLIKVKFIGGTSEISYENDNFETSILLKKSLVSWAI